MKYLNVLIVQLNHFDQYANRYISISFYTDSPNILYVTLMDQFLF